MEYTKEQIAQMAEDAFEYADGFESLPMRRTFEDLAMALAAIHNIMVVRGWGSLPQHEE